MWRRGSLTAWPRRSGQPSGQGQAGARPISYGGKPLAAEPSISTFFSNGDRHRLTPLRDSACKADATYILIECVTRRFVRLVRLHARHNPKAHATCADAREAY